MKVMSDRETRDIVELQQRLAARLAQLRFESREAAPKLAHHLAEIAVLSRNFAEHTLPLFLDMSEEHADALGRLAVSVKCDLDEIRDAIADIGPDVIELMHHLNPQP